jgi:hypothetical protein
MRNNMATLVALLGMIFLGACLVGLVALVTPAALGIVIVGFGFFLVGAFHYVTWGWWFMRPRADRRDVKPPEDE